MRKIEFNSKLWLKRIGICVMLLSLVNYAESAPQQYQTTTESQRLTTIQYYVNPVNNRQKQQEQEQLYDYYDYEEVKRPKPPYPTLKPSTITPAEFLMTVVRTALDVVKNINRRRMTSRKADNSTEIIKNDKLEKMNTSTSIIQSSSNQNDTTVKANVTTIKTNVTDKHTGRVMDDHDHLSYDHDHLSYDHYPTYLIAEHPPEMETTTTEKPMPVEVMKPRYADPWTGYYDFIINEGSFKFWSGFQLFTALLLLYSALSAIYYAKFNPITPDYDTTYDDYFFGRSLEDAAPAQPASSASPAPGWISSLAGMGSQTYQRIMETIHSSKHKYS